MYIRCGTLTSEVRDELDVSMTNTLRPTLSSLQCHTAVQRPNRKNQKRSLHFWTVVHDNQIKGNPKAENG